MRIDNAGFKYVYSYTGFKYVYSYTGFKYVFSLYRLQIALLIMPQASKSYANTRAVHQLCAHRCRGARRVKQEQSACRCGTRAINMQQEQ